MLELFRLFSLIQEAVSLNIQLPLTVIGWVSNIRRISQFGYLSCQFNRNQLYMFDFETHLILLSSKELSNISEGSLFIGIKGLRFFNNLNNSKKLFLHLEVIILQICISLRADKICCLLNLSQKPQWFLIILSPTTPSSVGGASGANMNVRRKRRDNISEFKNICLLNDGVWWLSNVDLQWKLLIKLINQTHWSSTPSQIKWIRPT